MSELVSDLVVVMGELFQSFIVFNPVLEMTLNVVKTLGIQFAALALVISDMVVSVIGWVREFLGLSSLKTIAKQEPKIPDNTGAAATSVSTGKPEDALRKARESAFQMGTGGAMKPEEQTAKNTDEIKKAILEAKEGIKNNLDAIVTAVTNFPTDMKNTAILAVDEFLRGIENAVQGINPFASTSSSGGGSSGGSVSVEDVIREQLKRLNPFG